MNPYREQLSAVLRAVAVRGLDGYTWLGRRSRALPPAVRADMDAAARRRYLVHCLREELYWSFYCPGRVVAARWGEQTRAGSDPGLAGAVAEANTGRGGWQAGWTVERVDRDDVVVASESVRVRARVPLADVRGPVGAPTPGAGVRLPAPPEPSVLSPGFLAVVGDAGDLGDEDLVRVYWHIGPRGAAELVRALTAGLNTEAAPFRLKVADHPLRFDRCDAAVLYLPAVRFTGLRPALTRCAGQLARWLRPSGPALTLPLAPGVGLAEGTGAGESFGERRCALIAEGIVEAYERGATREETRLAAVAASFARGGVDIETPYLEPALAGRHVL
jgi:hypothetical protein